MRKITLAYLFMALAPGLSCAMEEVLPIERGKGTITPKMSQSLSPGFPPGFSKDPSRLRASLFEVIGGNLLLSNVLPHLRARSLQALCCTSGEGLALVQILKERLLAKPRNDLTIYDFRVANSIHVPLYFVQSINYKDRTWRGDEDPSDLQEPLNMFLAQLGTKRLTLGADGTVLPLSESETPEPHIYRLEGQLENGARTTSSIRLAPGTEAPILFDVPDLIGQFIGLSELTLINNCVITLPHTLSELKQLVRLNLTNNNLQKVPPVILLLGSLRDLVLSNNKLEDLPKDMNGLKELRALALNDNPIRALPPGVLTLHKLRSLYVRGTMITYLPMGLCHMPKLKLIMIGHVFNYHQQPNPNLTSNLKYYFLNGIFSPFIIVPESWDEKKVDVLTADTHGIVRDSITSISKELMFRGLLALLSPVAIVAHSCMK